MSGPKQEIYKVLKDGVLELGDVNIGCAVIDVHGEPVRVLSQNKTRQALGITGRPTQAIDVSTGARGFVHEENISKYISSKELQEFSAIYTYRDSNGGTLAYGIHARYLPLICSAYADAWMAQELLPHQLHVAKRALVLMKGFMHVGITALVDEATGYDDPNKEALRDIMRRHLRDCPEKWQELFHEDFFVMVYSLLGLPEYKKGHGSKYIVVSRFIRDNIYKPVLPDVVYRELLKRNPGKNTGWKRYRDVKHHQYLQEQYWYAIKERIIIACTNLRTAISCQFPTQLYFNRLMSMSEKERAQRSLIQWMPDEYIDTSPHSRHNKKE